MPRIHLPVFTDRSPMSSKNGSGASVDSVPRFFVSVRQASAGLAVDDHRATAADAGAADEVELQRRVLLLADLAERDEQRHAVGFLELVALPVRHAAGLLRVVAQHVQLQARARRVRRGGGRRSGAAPRAWGLRSSREPLVQAFVAAAQRRAAAGARRASAPAARQSGRRWPCARAAQPLRQFASLGLGVVDVVLGAVAAPARRQLHRASRPAPRSPASAGVGLARPGGQRALEPLRVVAAREVLAEVRAAALGAYQAPWATHSASLSIFCSAVGGDELGVGAAVAAAQADAPAALQQLLQLVDAPFRSSPRRKMPTLSVMISCMRDFSAEASSVPPPSRRRQPARSRAMNSRTSPSARRPRCRCGRSSRRSIRRRSCPRPPSRPPSCRPGG
jgi:hypothetical protein